MKKLILLSLCLSLYFIGQAQVSKTVNVTTAGNLSAMLTATEKTTVTNLTVTGNIDAGDVKCLRDELTVLSSLNIENVSIKAYNGLGGTILESTSYPANEMPAYSFYNSDSKPSVSKVSLTSFIFPTTITSIGDNAFFQCTGLTGILSIPSSVNNIGSSVYQDCTGISGKLVLPNSLTIIRNCTFGWCSGLTELVIGSKVNAIESEAFTDCHGIKKVSIASVVPPTIAANSFGFDKSTCALYVPIGSRTAYNNDLYWGDFGQILEYNLNTDIRNNDENRVKIHSSNSSIIVEGTYQNEIISIYNTIGKLIRTVKSVGQKISIPLQKGNIYFVKTNQEIQKALIF